jgi:hypothetical protein
MQSLKHYKVLHEHDNLTGSPISPTPDRAHYGTNEPDLPFAHWNRYNPLASPCLRRGKGSPCEKERGAFYEEES